MFMRLIKKMRGFTLIELIIVMGILGVLLSIVLIALNPQQQFRQANNTQRQSDVRAILNAVHEYIADHRGAFPAGMTTATKTITSSAGINNIDLCTTLSPGYLADIPIDPTAGIESPVTSKCTDPGATYDSGYTITVDTNNRITVTAPSSELGAIIGLTL
jgi:prepilin-type N-terminal cleavage/methylation domain-containing protein